MKDLTHKIVQFFSGEDFAEHGDDARLELTPAELRQICNLMRENARLKTELDFIEKKTTLYMLRKKNIQMSLKLNCVKMITLVTPILLVILVLEVKK